MAAIKPIDFKLFDDCEAFLRLVSYKPGMIEFNPAPGAPGDLAGRIQQVLSATTGARWSILISDQAGASTARETAAREADAVKNEVRNHPLVAAALAIFDVPDAEIDRALSVKPLREAEPADEFLAPVPEDDDTGIEIEGDLVDGDDPFEEDY